MSADNIHSLGRVLITGGLGFIGRNLIRHLQQQSLAAHIRVLDNERAVKKGEEQGLEVEFLHGDIRDRQIVMQAVQGMDVVVHLAADTRVMDSITDPDFNFSNNVLGSFNILMAMREHEVGRMVNASTGGAIIGEVPPPVHEKMLPRPISPYGASKLAVEGYCSAFAGSYGIKAVSLRFANVYGPYSMHKQSVVATFIKKILRGAPLVIYGDGSQMRDYIHVNDICDGIIKALTSGKDGVYQLGTGTPTSLNELLEILRIVVGNKRKISVEYKNRRQGEILHTYCDISHAQKELGFYPRVELHKGIADTWDWFLQQMKGA